ncbi:MAG: 30S ribosomal protein S17 [Armatimonadota bacterium]
MTQNVKKEPRILEGVVIGDSMDKTIVVGVERLARHPLYEKVLRRTTKFHVHDENNECSVGDRVLIAECRPLSKTKSWRLKEVLSRAK